MKHRKIRRPAVPAEKDEEIVRLEDLTPRDDEAKGGERKQLFGQELTRRPGRRRR